MTAAVYREADLALSHRIDDAREEIASLLAMPAVRRAMLPPALVVAIEAVKEEIDAALAKAPDIHALARLEQALGRLRALHVRANEVAQYARERRGDVPPPPPARGFALIERAVDVSVEEAFVPQFGAAKSSRHGVGMLAEIEHDHTPLWFVARGRATSRWHAMANDAHVDCRLRAAAPIGPRMVFRKRSGLERLFGARGEVVSLNHPLDEMFLVRGDADLVAALLDRELCEALAWMAANDPWLIVTDGVVELAWTDRYDPLQPMLPGAMLHVVTTIAKRLYA